jgi:hypothetical protein
VHLVRAAVGGGSKRGGTTTFTFGGTTTFTLGSSFGFGSGFGSHAGLLREIPIFLLCPLSEDQTNLALLLSLALLFLVSFLPNKAR